MSKYTTELRYIVENEKLFPPSVDSLSLTNILNNFPLENETIIDPLRKNKTRREILIEKIINHYYFREIGFETTPRFLFALDRRLNEIMTIYNQRYKSIDMDINPINNVDMTETFTHTVNDSGTTSSTGNTTNSGTNTNTSDNIDVENDTPPTELTDVDIQGNKFASRTSHNKNTSSETLGAKVDTEGTIDTTGLRTETYERKETGSSKGYTFAQNIEQWRNIMINIENEIIDELKDLFINLW